MKFQLHLLFGLVVLIAAVQVNRKSLIFLSIENFVLYFQFVLQSEKALPCGFNFIRAILSPFPRPPQPPPPFMFQGMAMAAPRPPPQPQQFFPFGK